jgi:hypothetical protein
MRERKPLCVESSAPPAEPHARGIGDLALGTWEVAGMAAEPLGHVALLGDAQPLPQR